MNDLVKTGFMEEMKYEDNFAFILKEDNALRPTEYKVLQSQREGNFVKCMRLRYNGNEQLYYLAKGKVAFANLVSTLDAEAFVEIVANLFSDIMSVKNNGFLSCQSIDISFEHIFVNPSTYKISLVYLPIARRLYNDILSFESELRANLIKLIQNSENLNGSRVEQLKMDLSDGRMTLEGVLDRMRNGRASGQRGMHPTAMPGQSDNRNQNRGNMRLVATNTPVPQEIDITKDEFFLGRKEEWVDAVVSSSKKISRRHCKIMRRGNEFSLMNLSDGGTYVNGVRIKKEETTTLKDGDGIRLSFLEYKVIMS